MPSGFQSDAIIRDLQRSEIVKRNLPIRWYGELQRDLICVSAIAGTITVPAMMITDGASIPRVLWNMLSDTDPDILYPSYAHDYLYLLRGKLPNVTLTNEQADEIIREQMIIVGAPRWKADAVFHVLRAYWGEHGWDRIVRPEQLVSLAQSAATASFERQKASK